MHVTSSGRHGGCKEDKDEQSSLPVCELEAHDFGQAKPDRWQSHDFLSNDV
ncbi:hypothetical protein SHPE106448_01530 [Shewanella pealeana]